VRRRYLDTLAGTLAGALLFSALPIFGQSASTETLQPAAARAELERVGATIRAINIATDNVFDPNNPKEDKRLYRLANNVHINTHADVIANALLFQVGDAFETRLLEESARSLRAVGFLADVTIEPSDYDPATNSVEIDVRVRDSWTLAADLKFRHSGGASEWGAGLEDGNLLGMGKELKVSYRSFVDRDEMFFGYVDPNLLGTRARLDAVYTDASDGYRHQLGIERPFYALDTRWSLGTSLHDEERIDKMYDLGEEVDRFHHSLRSATLQGGWSRGLIESRAQRWLLGFTTEEDHFEPAPEASQPPLLLPPDRKLVYPWFGWQLVEDDYREMSQLNDMGRTEDISLGLNLFFSIGFAKESFGSDRDATLFRASAQSGWELGGPGRMLLLDAGGSTRNENDGLHNSQMYMSARYFQRNLDKHLLSVSLNALATNNLDPEQQVLLGGDNGLRGYPLRYQAGEQRAVLTIEERFFTEWYPWRLVRVGYALFADAGQVRGHDPRAAPSLGMLYDVGIGLRLSSPRASGHSIVHVDLAFPLNGDPSIDKVQLVIETKGSF
jgi:outer membrane protein assembly factor BamA